MHSLFRRFLHCFVFVAVCVAPASALHAQVAFTFTGIHRETSAPFTIVFSTSAAFHVAEQPLVTLSDDGGVPSSAQYIWAQLPESESGSDRQLLSGISGSSLSGSFIAGTERVVGFGFENNLNTGASTFLFIGMDMTESGFGPTFTSGIPLRFFYSIIPGITTFTTPAAGISAGSYFAAFNGTYELEASGAMLLSDAPFDSEAHGETIEITSVTISGVASASAVPEPATYAALAGAGALGFAAWRRRQPALGN